MTQYFLSLSFLKLINLQDLVFRRFVNARISFCIYFFDSKENFKVTEHEYYTVMETESSQL